MTVDYVLHIPHYLICLKKRPNLKNSNRLPSDEYTRESITNTHNFTNIRENLKLFLGVSIGARRSYLMKKTGIGGRSANYVPLIANSRISGTYMVSGIALAEVQDLTSANPLN
jgi:hypothetical protein